MKKELSFVQGSPYNVRQVFSKSIYLDPSITGFKRVVRVADGKITAKSYLCIGGPLDGLKLPRHEVSEDYIEFNCSSRGMKSKYEQQRAKSRGKIIIPSMVWIHEDLFKALWNYV